MTAANKRNSVLALAVAVVLLPAILGISGRG
jgi:hypothetical protein